jgi:ribosomal protein S28E/S33
MKNQVIYSEAQLEQAQAIVDANVEKMTIVKKTGYDSQFGYVSIITMSDKDNKAFTYKGTSFPVAVSVGDIIEIKGTIKHGEYKETKQSFVQRVKVLN